MHTYCEKYEMHHIQKRKTPQEATEQQSHGLLEDLSTDAPAKYQNNTCRSDRQASAAQWSGAWKRNEEKKPKTTDKSGWYK